MKKSLKCCFLGMALLSPLSLCLTGCNNYSPILSHIVDVIKNNFNKNPNEIKLGDANDYNEALTNFKSLLNQQQREDEIIYSQFNFIGQKGINNWLIWTRKMQFIFSRQLCYWSKWI